MKSVLARLNSVNTKRLIDLLGAIVALIALAPLMAVAALAIRLDSPGPAVYRQTRIGKDGQPFTLFKLRSMVVNSESLGGYSTGRSDARVTRIGRFIRKTSIDELPQLFNVLRGDMSLVGPRPLVPAQKALHSMEQWNKRCSVRPGITGLAQARLRSEGTNEQRIALDLQYVAERSLCLDAWIILLTFKRITGKGSN